MHKHKYQSGKTLSKTINQSVHNKKWIKRRIVGLPYEENVDRGLKNVSAKGNLPQESLTPSTERLKSYD